jgi:hypothetical protein
MCLLLLSTYYTGHPSQALKTMVDTTLTSFLCLLHKNPCLEQPCDHQPHSPSKQGLQHHLKNTAPPQPNHMNKPQPPNSTAVSKEPTLRSHLRHSYQQWKCQNQHKPVPQGRYHNKRIGDYTLCTRTYSKTPHTYIQVQ